MNLLGFDTETHLIAAPDQIIPRLVCGSWSLSMASDGAYRIPAGGEFVWSNGNPQELYESIHETYFGAMERRHKVIIQNAAFDHTVVMRYAKDQAPYGKGSDLYYLIWDVLEQNLDDEWNAQQAGQDANAACTLHDTIIREKLKNLSKHGNLTQNVYTGQELRYSLADLVFKYFKRDIKDTKVKIGADGRIYDGNDQEITNTPAAAAAWRLRYSELDGLPMVDWPHDAYNYALQDASWARLIYAEQEAKRSPLGHGSINSEALQIYADVCLRLVTANGFRIDRAQVAKVTESVTRHLGTLETHLRNNGILRNNGSVNKAMVEDRVSLVWDQLGKEPLMTEKGHIATGKEAMEVLTEYDPALAMYSERQKWSKIRDAFLPNLGGDMVYTQFDILKETGRTSSYGSDAKKAKGTGMPAVNSQQMPRKPGIRETFLPTEPGYLITSVDYGALELCSVAQCTYNLFGYSVHRDKINAGFDLHTYLGASIAAMRYPFLIEEEYENKDKAYAVLNKKRKYRKPRDADEKDPIIKTAMEHAKLAKKMRDMSKPTGLGYPGGLSPKTMVVYAKTVYGVDVTLEEATQLKDLWFQTYPEMTDYFAWVREQRDDQNNDDQGQSLYCYETPGFRRFRAGAFYCATANGASMQSLSADGAKRSICWLGRSCAGGIRPGGASPFAILDSCFHLTFIHDEHLVCIPDDFMATERALAVQELMILAMQVHMPDVRISAEPALMRRWCKGADPIWEDHPTERQWAIQQVENMYGVAEAAMVESTLIPPEGKRLRPWDDSNKWGIEP